MGILKLGGIASGLDTEGLIKQLLSIERRPVSILEARRDELTTEMNAWRDLNTRLLNLQNRVSDLKKLTSAAWTAKKASVSDTTVLTASAASTALTGTYSVDVVSLAKATTYQSSVTAGDTSTALGLADTLTVIGGPGDGKTVTLDGSESLSTLATKLNDADLGFTASVLQVSPGTYALVMKGKDGAANDFSLADTGSGVATQLMGTKVTIAANAQLTVNNVAIESETNTVQDAIPGVTLTLHKAGSTSVTVADDTQKAVDAVKGFVDQYNSVVDFIEQQTKYDSRTKKAGTLFGESLVQNVSSSLSKRVLEKVTGLAGDIETVGQIGITTSRFVPGSPVSGKLTFDQAKFTEALQNNPEAVMNLFTLDDGTNQGIAVRTEEWLQSYTKTGGVVLNQVKSRDSEAERLKSRIAYFDQTLLPMKEQRLRNQFISLEKAMSTFQNQGNWLSMQISSMMPQQQSQ